MHQASRYITIVLVRGTMLAACSLQFFADATLNILRKHGKVSLFLNVSCVSLHGAKKSGNPSLHGGHNLAVGVYVQDFPIAYNRQERYKVLDMLQLEDSGR